MLSHKYELRSYFGLKWAKFTKTIKSRFVKTVAICGKIEVNESFLKIFEFFENIFKPHVHL